MKFYNFQDRTKFGVKYLQFEVLNVKKYKLKRLLINFTKILEKYNRNEYE